MYRGMKWNLQIRPGFSLKQQPFAMLAEAEERREGKKDKKLRLTFVRLILLIFLLHWCWWSLFIRIMGESTFKCSGPGKMSAFYGVPRKMSCAVPSWWMDVSEYIAAPFFVLKYFSFTLSPHSLGTFSHFILLEQCRKSSTRSGVLGSSTLFHDQTLSPFHKQGSGGWIFRYFWCVFVRSIFVAMKRKVKTNSGQYCVSWQ